MTTPIGIRSVEVASPTYTADVVVPGHESAGVRVSFAPRIGGAWMARSITITAPDDGELDPAIMRAIKLPAIRRAAQARVGQDIDQAVREHSTPDAPSVQAARQLAQSTSGIGAKDDARSYLWNNEVLEKFAREAIRAQTAFANGEITSTREHMIDWLRHYKADATDGTVRDVMRKARAGGFIAGTKRGSRDVVAGPRLASVINAEQTNAKRAAKATTKNGRK